MNKICPDPDIHMHVKQNLCIGQVYVGICTLYIRMHPKWFVQAGLLVVLYRRGLETKAILNFRHKMAS